MANNPPDYTIILIILVVILFILRMWFYRIEQLYAEFFRRPFYVHLYVRPKRLGDKPLFLLRQHSAFYNRLSEKRKCYFEHRVACFIMRYAFVGRQGFQVTEEVAVRIAETYAMLTFGMRNYLVDTIDKIIIYPSAYQSTVSGEMHKGEFNPALHTVVFSWEDFLAGTDSTSDNLHLGIHEFAHVLQFHGKKSNDVSAAIFSAMYAQIQREVNHPPNREKLTSSNYFRIYAYTNQYEFLAVILEHYFETPDQFRMHFPQLYHNVSKMLNHRHG